MSADRLPGLVLPAVFLIAVVGVAVVLWWERRRSSSPARRRDVLADWHGLPTSVQEACDTAVLDAAEADERMAGEHAERAVQNAARTNALYRP
jgi:hypothetical protein